MKKKEIITTVSELNKISNKIYHLNCPELPNAWQKDVKKLFLNEKLGIGIYYSTYKLIIKQ